MSLTYVENLSLEHNEVSTLLGKAAECYKKKLYHQLTDVIEELFAANPSEFRWLDFESRFMSDVRQYMNPLRYASIVVKISKFASNPTEGINFVKNVSKSLEDSNSKLLLSCQQAYFEIKIDRKVAKQILEEVENEMNNTIKIPPAKVRSHYHFVCAQLFKSLGNTEKFYSNGMSYLGYTDLNELSKVTKLEWGNDIALAALVSKSFYDFGELQLHPVMSSLKNSKYSWVLEIVESFIKGDIEYYNKVISKYNNNISNNKLLNNNKKILDEKMKLLALVKLAFYKPSEKKVLTFKEISVTTNCDLNNVEYIIMRCMSLKLIDGIMDGIDQTVSINYVKPRILDINEIKSMSNKVTYWVKHIQKIHENINNRTIDKTNNNNNNNSNIDDEKEDNNYVNMFNN